MNIDNFQSFLKFAFNKDCFLMKYSVDSIGPECFRFPTIISTEFGASGSNDIEHFECQMGTKPYQKYK